MPRFLALVLALLLPLQSMVAIAASGVCPGHARDSYEQLSSARAASLPAGCHAAPGHAGPHGPAGHHLTCPHLPSAFPGLPCAVTKVAATPGAVPRSLPVAFDSIVLDVPLPPPLRA